MLVRFSLVAMIALVASTAIAQETAMPHMALACKEMDILIRANDMMLSNDYASFKAYLTNLMRAGACKILDQGERVLVEKKEGPALCLRLCARPAVLLGYCLAVRAPMGQSPSFFVQTVLEAHLTS